MVKRGKETIAPPPETTEKRAFQIDVLGRPDVASKLESIPEMLAMGVMEPENVSAILRAGWAEAARAIREGRIADFCRLIRTYGGLVKIRQAGDAAMRPQLHGHIHHYEQTESGRSRLSEITAKIGLTDLAERYREE